MLSSRSFFSSLLAPFFPLSLKIKLMLAIQIILVFITPYFLVRVSKALKIEAILSPVVLCYALGLAVNNFLPKGMILPEGIDILTQATIALAIPLVLMNSDFKSFLNGSKTILISFASAIFAVFVSCMTGAFIFQSQTDNAPEIAGMLAGVYSGGTPNMAAIQAAIKADTNLYGALNIADILMGGIYLIFLTSIGPRVFRFLLGAKKTDGGTIEETTVEATGNNVSLIQKLKSIFIPIAFAILCIALSAGISFLIFNKIDEALFIILITIFGTGISFFSFSKKLTAAYDTGDYLLLVFSLALGLMSDFSAILNASSAILYFTVFVITSAIFLHVLLAKIFKIDGDTTLITSAACIFGPVFIGQVVSVMKNKSMLVPGMAMGVAGMALGSFLGIFIFKILNALL
jgi:uncharacterized membrane protein